jgi:hypothetical protein
MANESESLSFRLIVTFIPTPGLRLEQEIVCLAKSRQGVIAETYQERLSASTGSMGCPESISRIFLTKEGRENGF